MRGGMGRPISKSPMGFALFICRPIVPSCSLQKPYGRLSTSRSSITTLQPSRSSTQKSPNNASPSSSSPNKSNRAPISIGGQSQSFRINYPEIVLQAIVKGSDSQLKNALDLLVASGLIFQEGDPPAAKYLFKHALVQEAAYSTLLHKTRQLLHARIGEALENRFAERVNSGEPARQ